MSNLTRDQFVTELQVRGWSRFQASELQTYLNWGLQEVYRRASWPAIVSALVTVTGNTDGSVEFTSINSNADLIHTIDGVHIKTSAGDVLELDAISEDSYRSIVVPNFLRTTPDKGVPVGYAIDRKTVWLHPVPIAATDVTVAHRLRTDTFASGSATTGMPERMDILVLLATERLCFQRAKDYEGMIVVESLLNETLNRELGQQGMLEQEFPRRVIPYRGG